MKKEKSDQNAVAELTREGLYKENKWLWEENKNLKLIQETNEKQIKNNIKERDELREENKTLKKERDLYKARNEELNEDCFGLAKENKKLKSDLMQDMKEITELEIENKNLNDELIYYKQKSEFLNKVIVKYQEENQYRESIADVLPEGEGHIAEETIQDLQDRINELIGKIDQLEEENENLRKDLFHLTNNGKAK